jgi:hypothetical protein
LRGSATIERPVGRHTPLKEVLLLTCATIAGCDDFEAIVSWGEHRLAFLRRFSDFYHGVPCARWLRDLMNRIDPALFARRFEAFVASMWPGKHDFIAIDGKTARRTHDKTKGPWDAGPGSVVGIVLASSRPRLRRARGRRTLTHTTGRRQLSAERLLTDTGWLPEPLRRVDLGDVASDGDMMVGAEGEALPEFLTCDDQEAADDLDEPHTLAAE